MADDAKREAVDRLLFDRDDGASFVIIAEEVWNAAIAHEREKYGECLADRIAGLIEEGRKDLHKRVAELCTRVLADKAGIDSRKTQDMARDLRRECGG